MAMFSLGLLIDHAALLEALAAQLAAQEDCRLVFARQELNNRHPEAGEEPSVIVLQTQARQVTASIKQAQSLFPFANLLLLSDERDEQLLQEVLALGISGWLPASVNFTDLFFACRRLHFGETILAPWIMKSVLQNFTRRGLPSAHQLDGSLTHREKDIVACLLRGLTYKQIGKELNLSVFTVNQHLKKIYLKKGVNSRHQLVHHLLQTDNKRH